MTTIHLVRHGQTHWNLERRIQGQTESQLNDLGKEQAANAGELLKNQTFDIAFASSSDRARETAEFILEHHQLPLNLQDNLREICLGPWEGQLYDDIMSIDPEQHENFWRKPHLFNVQGAETFAALQHRSVTAVQEIANSHHNKNILIVSHGCWIKSVLSFIEKRDMANFWLPPKMTNCCHSIIQAPTETTAGLSDFKILQYGNETNW